MHQVTSITNSQGTSSFQYDLAGNLVAESDSLGRVTSRSYNARGQETSVTLPDPDGAGPLTAPVFTKAFNARGELVSQTDAMGNSTSWTYNAQGQALTQTDPDPDGVGPLPAAVTHSPTIWREEEAQSPMPRAIQLRMATIMPEGWWRVLTLGGTPPITNMMLLAK